MKTIMLKIQIILTVIILIGVYQFINKRNADSGFDMSALDPMKQSIHVDSNDTFDILNENLKHSQNKTPEQIAEDLFSQAMSSPNAANKDQSEMMARAKVQAQKMLESGNVTQYRQEINKNTIMKRVIGE